MKTDSATRWTEYLVIETENPDEPNIVGGFDSLQEARTWVGETAWLANVPVEIERRTSYNDGRPTAYRTFKGNP